MILPSDEYHDRLQKRRLAVTALEQRHQLVARSRLATALAFLVDVWVVWTHHDVSRWWLAVPPALFIALVAIHERIAKAKRQAQRAVEFYEKGLARIEDRWAGTGDASISPEAESHLYAADLDIFGKGSLFELLSTVRTRAGEETLSSWLLRPATSDEILARQQAVEELRYKLDLREDLATLGSEYWPTIHSETLIEWGAAPPVLEGLWPRVVTPIIGAVLLASVVLTRVPGTTAAWIGFAIILAAAGAIGLIFRNAVSQVLSDAERPQKDFNLLSEILARIERETFICPRLVHLHRSLETAGVPPSRQISRVVRMSQFSEMRETDGPIAIVLFLVAGVVCFPFKYVFWGTQLAFAIEAWRKQCGAAIGQWLSTVGEFEALCALAGYAYEHPTDPFPEIVTQENVFQGENLRHPLLPIARCVANDVHFGCEPQFLVVSGSNMSGKSTLLRTVGINTVLALAGAPVRARRLRLSVVAVGATMRIQDSLQTGTSRFYAEIQRIHQIMDLTSGSLPVLFLLDEILHGTNSHDRAIGAEAIVRGLIARGAMGLVTTHDLALAGVAEALAPRAANVHFEDQIEDGKMVFDYRMRPGVVKKSNAIELMRAVGLPVD
jgi:hypothetical protein